MLKINLDYKFKYTPDELKDLDSVKSEVTLQYVISAVSQKYKDGLEGQLRRIWGRTQRKFEEAIDSKKYCVELEQAEKDLIVNSFKEAKFPANVSINVNILEDEFISKLTEETPVATPKAKK